MFYCQLGLSTETLDRICLCIPNVLNGVFRYIWNKLVREMDEI